MKPSIRGRQQLLKEGLVRLSRNRAAVVGGTIVPLLAPHPYAPPSHQYPLGADYLGRCLLSRLIYGTRVSFLVGLFGAVFSFGFGILYGTVAGYAGGKTDNLLTRIVDLLYAFPGMLFIILLMVTFKAGFGGVTNPNPVVRAISGIDKAMGGLLFILVGISITSWVGLARVSRGMALSLREVDFVKAARAVGASHFRVATRHVVPNIVGPILINVVMAIPGFIGTEAFLSFIGIGVTPPTHSWGAMISEGILVMRSYPHMMLYPGLALAITMFATGFLGDGLRDAFDPRMQR